MKTKINYYKGNELTSEIFCDFKTEKVMVINHSDQNMDTAFGIRENPSFHDFMEFLEERCVPRSRDRIKDALAEIGVDYYDPYEIVKRTNGRLEGDNFWLEVIEG